MLSRCRVLFLIEGPKLNIKRKRITESNVRHDVASFRLKKLRERIFLRSPIQEKLRGQ